MVIRKRLAELQFFRILLPPRFSFCSEIVASERASEEGGDRGKRQ
jgi:hypothetical protein